MILVQWREGQKGKNVHLILSTALKELGLMAWHLNLPSPDVQKVLVQPSWTGTLPEMMKSRQNPRGQ